MKTLFCILFLAYAFLIFCGVAIVTLGLTHTTHFPSIPSHFIVAGLYWSVALVVAVKLIR